jgi:TonB family protein
MNRFLATTLLILLMPLVIVPAGFGQQNQTESNRRVMSRVTPHYPEIARNMHLEGIVKAEAVVDSSGKVKSIEVKGGHPLLVRAAEDAIQRWRWVPATRETRESIEVRFNAP